MPLVDADQVAPWLWVGSQPGHDEELPPGVKAVFSFREEPQLPEAVRKAECFVWRPLRDGSRVSVEWLTQTVDLVMACKSRDSSVLLHCLLGASRSIFVATACLVKADRINPSLAYTAVKSSRLSADMAGSFYIALEAYARSLQCSPATTV